MAWVVLRLTAFLLGLAIALPVFGQIYEQNQPGLISVTNNAALKAKTFHPAGTTVYRAGFGTPGDGGGGFYTFSILQCTINTGAGDNGAQVAPNIGTGCWRLTSPDTALDPRIWGAACDGSTDDSPAFAALLAVLEAEGSGVLMVPATGHSCYLGEGITLPNNIIVQGLSLHHWPGLHGSPEQWAASGSWIKCGDLVNPCITINGVGDEVTDLNFIYNQPTPPSSGPWFPTIFPYTIAINGSANYTGLSRLSITAATHCIDWEGPVSGVAGIASFMHDIYFNGCFNVGTRFARIDNTLQLSNLRYVDWWYTDLPPVVAYMETHKVDWDLNYLANAQANDVEFYESKSAIQLTNNSVASGFGTITFAAANLQLTNISFNEVCQGITQPGGNGTISSGVISNLIAYGDTSTGCPLTNPILIDLSSDQANWAMDNVSGGFVQTVAAIGHGSGGILKLHNIDVAKYSAFAASAPAFKVSANASFEISGSPLRGIRPGAGGGPILGLGVDSTQGYLEHIVGGASGTEGTAVIGGSSNNTSAGQIEFFAPDGVTRRGFIGRGSAAGEINIAPDGGASVAMQGPVVMAVVPFGTTIGAVCSGKPSATVWLDTSTSPGHLSLCP